MLIELVLDLGVLVDWLNSTWVKGYSQSQLQCYTEGRGEVSYPSC